MDDHCEEIPRTVEVPWGFFGVRRLVWFWTGEFIVSRSVRLYSESRLLETVSKAVGEFAHDREGVVSGIKARMKARHRPLIIVSLTSPEKICLREQAPSYVAHSPKHLSMQSEINLYPFLSLPIPTTSSQSPISTSLS